MATYSSKPIEIPMQAESVYEKVSNLSGFQERIDNLPQDVKDKIGAVRFTEDSIFQKRFLGNEWLLLQTVPLYP